MSEGTLTLTFTELRKGFLRLAFRFLSTYELMIDHLLSWKYDPWRSGTSFSIGFGFPSALD